MGWPPSLAFSSEGGTPQPLAHVTATNHHLVLAGRPGADVDVEGQVDVTHVGRVEVRRLARAVTVGRPAGWPM